MKVLIGPLNIASQPYYLARGLRDYGVDATCVVYGTDKSGRFGYKHDWHVDVSGSPVDRARIFADTLKRSLEHDYDIYHFFQRSLFPAWPNNIHEKLIGFDIPLLKARGKKLAYRFTGWEVINQDIEKTNNPYSALFEKDFDGLFDQNLKPEYINFLRSYIDEFMVVDPMMHEHIPEAKIVPRVLRVADFEHVGIEKTDRPLILHAPTNPAYKGTKYILAAFDKLKEEGLEFDVKLLGNMPFDQAMEWYKKCDILVDQIHVGWYGVLAMELMAMGKPVAVYMRPDLANTPEDVPIHNINKDNIVDRLRELILDFNLRQNLSARGRDYIGSVSDESVVIPKLIDIYRDMMERPYAAPKTTADIDFLFEQRRVIETAYGELNALRTKHKEKSLLRRLQNRTIDLITANRRLQKLAKKVLSLMPVRLEMALRKKVRARQIESLAERG